MSAPSVAESLTRAYCPTCARDADYRFLRRLTTRGVAGSGHDVYVCATCCSAASARYWPPLGAQDAAPVPAAEPSAPPVVLEDMTVQPVAFSPPATLEEARLRRAENGQRLLAIQGELSAAKEAYQAQMAGWTRAAYAAWRGTRTAAQRRLIAEAIALRDWMAAAQREAHAPALRRPGKADLPAMPRALGGLIYDPTDAHDLVIAATALLTRLADDDVPFTVQEQQLFSQMQRFRHRLLTEKEAGA